jgi:DNA-binding SARP family transcriptional activator
MGRTDLGFNETEAVDLLAVHGLTSDDAARYAAQSDGWATGVLLFARAAPGGMRLLHNRADLLLEQLGSQVLAALPSDLRRFILETAALGPASANEADAILGRTGSAALFSEILARDLFLVRNGQTFRFHDLFADYFRGLLGKEDPERLSAIRHAAARWWLERRDLPRALALIAQTEDWPLLAATLEANRRMLWEQRLWGAILTSVDLLPPSYRTARLLALCGHARAERGEYQAALAFADGGKAAAANDEEWLSPALLHADTLMQAGRYGECVDAATASLTVAERIGQAAIVDRLREARGAARFSLGDLAGGRQDLLVALDGYRARGDAVGEGRNLYILATLLLEMGERRDAEEYLAQAGHLWRQEDNRPMLAHLGTSRALLHILTGDLDEARKQAELAVDLSHECGDPLSECAAMIMLTEAVASSGLALEADRIASAAAEMAQRLGLEGMITAAMRARITTALARRDRAGARRLLEETRPLAATPVDQALHDLLDGAAALRARAHPRAIVLLDRAQERLEAVCRNHQAARACLLRAEALLAVGASSKAEIALNRMATLILPLGCEAFLWPTARMTRQVLAERHLLRRIRIDTRQLLDRMAGAIPSLALVLPQDEDEGSSALCLSPFGQGRITLGDLPIANSALPPKARELLFFSGQAHGPIQRARLLEVLWEDRLNGPRELWDATRHLRRVLGERSWTVRRGSYALTLPVIDEGSAFFAAAEVACGKGATIDRLAAGERALALVGSAGYLDWCESLWAESARARVQRRAVGTALALTQIYQELDRLDDAEASCRRAIGFEPLEEAPRFQLIRLLAGEGRKAAAAREYNEYRALTREELGTEPSAELRRLAANLPVA